MKNVKRKVNTTTHTEHLVDQDQFFHDYLRTPQVYQYPDIEGLFRTDTNSMNAGQAESPTGFGPCSPFYDAYKLLGGLLVVLAVVAPWLAWMLTR